MSDHPSPIPSHQIDTREDLSNVSEEDWELALRRKDAIEALLLLERQTEADVKATAQSLGYSVAWMYRLIQRYKTEGTVSCLLPQKRSGGKGKSRLDPELDAIIEETISALHLTHKRLKPLHIVREVRSKCLKRGRKAPAENTIRSRIKDVPARISTKYREGGKIARDKFAPAAGQFPQPKWPLSVVQMDHSPTDIIIVDEKYRRPIGRAYFTIAIDLYSRAILGMHLSLEAPSATSVGLCLVHAVCPKVEWLKQRDINAEWPMWGKMDVLHVDNGSDFRSEALQRGCAEHGIQLEYRPVKNPKFGGTVERIFRTLNSEVHGWEGTTFSNVNERGTYSSEKHACLTLKELERLLTIVITKKYHESPHSALLMSPRRAFEKGIFGDDHDLGRGMPSTVTNPRQFLIDFLPVEKRSVQREGVVWDYIHYFEDSLRPFIDRKDKRKFIVRRDPRDISKIFLFCPDTKTYLEIPYRNIANPSISLWEHKAARQWLKDRAQDDTDEAAIFRALEEIQAEIDSAKVKTKRARRDAERKKVRQKQLDEIPSETDRPKPSTSTKTAEALDLDLDDRFDDIEHW